MLLEQFEPSDRSSLDIDYDLYADGEVQLAWLDESMTIVSPQQNAVMIANEIIAQIDHDIKEKKLTIGHLKFFIETPNWKKKIVYDDPCRSLFYSPEENDASTGSFTN